MKKIYILLLLLPLLGNAQWYNIDYEENFRFVSFGIDPANAIYGSPKNAPGLDLVAKIGARHGHVQVAMFYERFELMNYQSYGFQPSMVLRPLRNVATLIGTEVSMINRMGPTFMSYALNVEVEYHLRRFFVYAKADLKRRPGITQGWCYSNYVGIAYKF